MNKKGDISQPFVYIFGIVSGSLILGFLLWFGFGHVNIETKKSSEESAFYFDEALRLLSASEDVSEPLLNPLKREYEIFCGTLRVGSSKPSKLDSIVFSPRKLSSRSLSVYSKAILFPFKVANIFIVTEQSRRYLFVYDEATRKLVESFKNDVGVNLPKHFNFQIISKQNFLSKIDEIGKQEKIERIVVFFRLSAAEINKISSKLKDTKILIVDYQEGYGKVNFLEGKEFKESGFFSLPLLYGAIFSENYDTYECGKEILLKRLKLLAKLYSQKALLMTNALQSCPYNQASGILNSLNTESLEALKSFYTALTEQNEQLAGGNCPPLF